MINVYYHVYLTDNPAVWSGIVREQLECMKDAYLLNHINNIEFIVISQNDSRIQTFINFCELFETSAKRTYNIIQNPYSNDTEMIRNINNDATVTENITMRKIFDDSKDTDCCVLYLHTKGITSTINYLEKGDVNTYMRYHYWRQYLNWGTLTKWTRCLNDIVDKHDVSGINYRDTPCPHYSGNFWWSKSSYIRTLPDPSTLSWWYSLKQKSNDQWLKTVGNRFRDEMWVCSNTNKISNIHKMDENPASVLIPTQRYKYDEVI